MKNFPGAAILRPKTIGRAALGPLPVVEGSTGLSEMSDVEFETLLTDSFVEEVREIFSGEISEIESLEEKTFWD